MRCNSAATEETFVVKLFISEASFSSVVSYIGRITDGYGCTLGINTATVAAGVDVITIGDIVVICCITRDDTAGEVQRRAIVSKDATARSCLVSRDHAPVISRLAFAPVMHRPPPQPPPLPLVT